jgi:large subunit ribosomal protein L3
MSDKKEKTEEKKEKAETAVEAKVEAKQPEAPEKKAEEKVVKAPAIIGKKIGMTQVFDETGKVIPVTVVNVDPTVVVNIRKEDKDGYKSIQVGFEQVEEKKLNKPLINYYKKQGLNKFFKYLKEFRVENVDEYNIGQEIKANIFNLGEKVDVSGVSIGKGFAGTVKRHHFGRGPMSHGSKSHRRPGSIGAGTTPGRVYKGVRMAGQLGNKMTTVKNLKVVEIDLEKNIILLEGAVPGKENSILTIRGKK